MSTPTKLTKLELQQLLQGALCTIEQLRSEISVLKGMRQIRQMEADRRLEKLGFGATEFVAGGR